MINLGSNVMGIGLSVALRDQFTNKARQVSSSMGMMTKNANAMRASLEGARLIGFGIAASGLLMANSYRKAVNTSMEFHAIMKGTQAVTQATDYQLKGLEATALSVSKSTIFTARETASAMEYLGKAGFTPAQIQGTIDAVTALGAATGTRIEGKGGAADMMTNMMTAFNLKVSQSGRAADILAKVTSKANLDIGDLEQSMKYLGSAAAAVKMPFEEAAAATSVLANAGIRGGMAGRGMANVLFYLSNAASNMRTPKQADLLNRLGITPQMLKTSTGELKPFVEVLDVLKNSVNKLPGPEKISAIKGLMNIRGARALLPLFDKKNLGLSFSEMLHTLQTDSQGAAAEMAKIRLDNLKGDITILSSAWEAFKIAQGDAITKPLRLIVKFLTKIVRVMTEVAEHPMGKALLTIGAALSVFMVGLGGTIVLMSTFKLMTLGMRGPLQMMKGSLVSTWTAGTAAAARYMAVAQGASYISPGGSYVVKGKKGFQSAKALKEGAKQGVFARIMQSILGRGTGSAVTGKGVKGFTYALSKSTLWLGKLARGFKFLAGTVGAVVGVVIALFGFKNILKAGTYVIGTFFQSLMAIVDYVVNIFKHGDFTGKIAGANFSKRQAHLKKTLGMPEEEGIFGWGKAPKLSSEMRAQKREDAKELVREMMRGLSTVGMNSKDSMQIVSKLTIDGREVADSVTRAEGQDLATLLGMTSQ